MRTIRFLLVILFGIAVAACGGGGGYGGGSSGGSTGYSISGMITGGAHNSGVTVTLTGAAMQSTTTSASGSYSFAGLASGNYTVTPSLAGYSFNPASAPEVISVYNTNPTANFTETP